MKIRNSLKSLKSRHRDCRVIRRRGRTYVINKTNRPLQGAPGLSPALPKAGLQRPPPHRAGAFYAWRGDATAIRAFT